MTFFVIFSYICDINADYLSKSARHPSSLELQGSQEDSVCQLQSSDNQWFIAPLICLSCFSLLMGQLSYIS
jgi:hypothetical protein